MKTKPALLAQMFPVYCIFRNGFRPSQKVTPPRLDKQANQTYVRKSAIALCPTGWQNFTQARSQEPRDENSADRNAELFLALFAQLLEQLFAQLPADVFVLMNTQDDTAHAINELHTAMQPIPGFGREPVFCYRQKFSFFSDQILLVFLIPSGAGSPPPYPHPIYGVCVFHTHTRRRITPLSIAEGRKQRGPERGIGPGVERTVERTVARAITGGRVRVEEHPRRHGWLNHLAPTIYIGCVRRAADRCNRV